MNLRRAQIVANTLSSIKTQKNTSKSLLNLRFFIPFGYKSSVDTFLYCIL